MSFENNIKGAIAEQLTKEIFLENNYEIHHYGIEYLVPGLNPRFDSKVNLEKGHRENDLLRQLTDFLLFLKIKIFKEFRGEITFPKLFIFH